LTGLTKWTDGDGLITRLWDMGMGIEMGRVTVMVELVMALEQDKCPR